MGRRPSQHLPLFVKGRVVTIHLALMLPSGSSDQPEGIGRAPYTPFYSVLLQVGFTQPASHLAAGELLPHHFTLTCPLLIEDEKERRPSPYHPYWAGDGRYVSVALSVELPLLGVTQHLARRSSDFPPCTSSTERSPGLLPPG